MTGTSRHDASRAAGPRATGAAPAQGAPPRPVRARSGLLTGLGVLEAVARAPCPPTLTRIAEDLGMSKPGVHAVLGVLVERGYLQREPSGGYVMGLRAWELGARMPGAAIALAATGPMAHLSDEVSEGAILGVLDGWDVVYLQVVEAPQAVRVNAGLGDRIPAHCTSTGLALLAALDPAEVAARMPGRLAPLTPVTLSTPQALAAELDRIRRDGFALNAGGWRADVGGIAMCVRPDPGGPAAAGLCVSAPLYRITPEWLDRVRDALGRAAEAIGANIAAARAQPAAGVRPEG